MAQIHRTTSSAPKTVAGNSRWNRPWLVQCSVPKGKCFIIPKTAHGAIECRHDS
ncbi:hypothetical protein ZHAS_00015981 [Anopheles sinensis]|uniref:Uncharacterized protein n=1 Tax=Anopheles sinensis TaxID=74873 RepID=A0A084WCH7_ANOSI|nr:hypothetical protein ZHAS_00015981 [Anopheles sinensis]